MWHFKQPSRLKKIIAIPVFLCLPILAAFGQADFAVQVATKKISTPTFYLYYGEAGLGSNMGDFLPTIRIKNGVLLYTYEQNSYWVTKENRIDTICITQVRQSSIDSILYLIQDIKDSTINEFNHCIMSGSIHSMTITDGIDTTAFSLMNTFDYTALKITHILNTYIPADKKLYVNEQMIKDAEDCWERRLKRWEEAGKKKRLKKGKKKRAT